MKGDADLLKHLEERGVTILQNVGVNLDALTAQQGTSFPADGKWSFFLIVWMELPSAANLREHWSERQRRVRQQREAVALVWRMSPIRSPFPEWHGKLIVGLTRYGHAKLDDDNLQGAFKAVRDEVATLLGVDDGDPRIIWRYRQKTQGRKFKQNITINIERRKA